MAISQTTHVNEVLLRKAMPNGTWAAHQKKITITSGAGVPVPDIYGDAEPLNVADLGDVLDPVFIDLTNERNAAVAAKAATDLALDAMTADRQEKVGALTAMTIDRDAQSEARTAAEQALAIATNDLAAARVRIQELEAAQTPADA